MSLEDNVYCIKLVSGEEIITKSNLMGINLPEYIDLIDARTLMAGPQGNMGLAPVMFSADPEKPIKLLTSSIASWSDNPREEIKNGYLQSISKLIIPNKSILMG